MGAGTDQYGAQEPRNIPSELERWLPLPAAELTTIDQGSTRIRLALSTTTRGWDYESTVEITAPSSNLTPAERAELIGQAAELQLRLRLVGATERDNRNREDKLGPYAAPKAAAK